ncbi:hypothetical protein [Emticicia sp. C21]|uniref:hypothetical protein n=1 Tax=Emticicia sp. C21 TaxID=2302915 RepID=UPI000E34A54E|nr:hypothetical protein [Emticicia sp. C21]RFS16091.1 hypothetical protein D0T08_14475 [Emticicia sp. C21]
MEGTTNKFDAELLKYLITAQSEATPIEELITIDESTFAINGGLSLVTGMPKGGKTTALRVMIETAFMEEIKEGYQNIGIRSKFQPDKSLIYINTEMTDADMIKFRNSITRALGREDLPENIYIFHLLTLFPRERVKLIEKIIQQAENASIVLIDGLADLVTSVNEEKDCNEVIQLLQNYAVNYKVGIIGVIHENRGNKQTRGHLGQQAERKCVGAISVAKNREKKIFELTATMTRHTDDFDKIIYRYNEKGRLERLDKTSPIVRAYSQETEEVEFARTIFADDLTLPDKVLRERLRKHFKDTEPNTMPTAISNKVTRKIEKFLHTNIIGDAGNMSYKLMFFLEQIEST